METPNLSGLVDNVQSAHQNFTAAHEDYEHAREHFNIAVAARSTYKQARIDAISSLEKLLKKMKREA